MCNGVQIEEVKVIKFIINNKVERIIYIFKKLLLMLYKFIIYKWYGY